MCFDVLDTSCDYIVLTFSNCKKYIFKPYDSADDWSEHISSSGKKYYYNCRTEVSQWEKPKEWLER